MLRGTLGYFRMCFVKMNDRARYRAGSVKKIGRESLNRFAMRQKLSLSNRVRRASCFRKFVHRGVADLTKDRFVGVEHRKSERLPFVVITNHPALRQRGKRLIDRQQQRRGLYNPRHHQLHQAVDHT